MGWGPREAELDTLAIYPESKVDDYWDRSGGLDSPKYRAAAPVVARYAILNSRPRWDLVRSLARY